MAPDQPAPGTSTIPFNADVPTPRHQHTSSREDAEVQGAKGALAPPVRFAKDVRSYSSASIFGPRTASLANTVAPGSFSSNLKSATPRTATRPDFSTQVMPGAIEPRGSDDVPSERRQAEYLELINKETKIKAGSENLLEALQAKNSKQIKDQRMRVELELTTSNRKIAELKSRLKDEIERSKRIPTPIQNRLSSLFPGGPPRSASRLSEHSSHGSQAEKEPQAPDEEEESPTFVLAELLQALELLGMQPSYYVKKANEIVDLLKRHSTLRYDLAWSIFGLRVQTMLLSKNRELRAAGYRVTRHAITDRKSVQTIRSLQTDSMIVLSLAKDPKSTIEMEQAFKLVRAFLDVPAGVLEISTSVLRAMIAVAEDHDQALQQLAQLTLAEVMVKNPEHLAQAGGIKALSDALSGSHYSAADSMVSAFLYLLDVPKLRTLLSGDREISGPFVTFTDPMVHLTEDRVRTSIRAVAAIVNSWPGLFALSSSGFASISALLLSLNNPDLAAKNVILDFLFDVLHIKTPTWTSSFLAGRRLTTYARVTKARIAREDEDTAADDESDADRQKLSKHYASLILLVFIRCGLIEALSTAREVEYDPSTNRKTILLLSEVLKLTRTLLPPKLATDLQMIPMTACIAADDFSGHPRDIGADLAFELDSINRTTQRPLTTAKDSSDRALSGKARGSSFSETKDGAAGRASPEMDDIQFRTLLIETRVVSSTNPLKWKWDLINDVIEGPMQNPKRVEDMGRSTKFMKRLMAFYRPLKYRFSDMRNTKPNQRYVRAGCALVRGLLKTQEGAFFLMEDKLISQVAEALAQLDKPGHASSEEHLFSRDRINETLTGGYFEMLGTLGEEPHGLLILSRWRMINTFHQIIESRDREDIIQLLLSSLDYTLDGHLRLLLGRALTSSTKPIRIFATKILRRYATSGEPPVDGIQARRSPAYWAIRLLITQLYDPGIEVSEVAVQILHEACNRKKYLEYVVKCRPALDHLGEIGAPLLLRFLSSSIGYEYLHGLEYITQEMDDWFLGRNDKYVMLVETSLFRAFSRDSERPRSALEDPIEFQQIGTAPPHFYRELARTEEGCKLLRESGHFKEFVATIRSSWAVENEPETLLKVRGCLWAVGNVGSMELGAPFLEESNIVDSIVDIAERSAVMSMKGTAFFVLGLISRSLHGMEMLADRGWDAATNEFGRSLGYVLPPSLEKLFPVRNWSAPCWLLAHLRQETRERVAPRPAKPAVAKMPPPLNPEDPLEQRFYRAVTDSVNAVFTIRVLNDFAA